MKKSLLTTLMALIATVLIAGMAWLVLSKAVVVVITLSDLIGIVTVALVLLFLVGYRVWSRK